MPSGLFWRALTLLLVIPALVDADEKLAKGQPIDDSSSLATSLTTSLTMSLRVDEILAKRWEAEGVRAAPLATDAEFLRRAWLDICGTIPPLNDEDGISGVRDFLRSRDPDKHRRVIDRLLAKPRHAAHLATIWKNVMLPADSNLRRYGGDYGFQGWLRGQFADNVSYKQLVFELLTTPGAPNQTGPTLYYAALQLKPEELAASTSRIFLGTQIQCAQCHDHPFDHWKRQDFWGYAAFFARLQRPRGQQRAFYQVVDAKSGEVMIPDTKRVVAPRFLGVEQDASEAESKSRRRLLAEWLTSGENPYFARATVNRFWKQMFGRGLVEPVDDLGEHNPPSHPQLLNELAAYFIESGFDIRSLIRALANTKAYQRSSQTQADSPVPRELFARMAIKSLTAEQLYDCLLEAARRRATANAVSSSVRRIDPNRQRFVAKFQASALSASEYEAGIPQALTLMNGTLIRQATDLGQSDLLKALDAPFFTPEKRVETLFLSALSRMPTDAERAEFGKYAADGKAKGAARQAMGDILWALLNSAEFVLNH